VKHALVIAGRRRVVHGAFAFAGIAALLAACLGSASAGFVGWVALGALVMTAVATWSLCRGAGVELAAADRELGERAMQLANLRARIEEHTSAQGRFVGNIAHELKTPLTVVLSQIDLMLGHEPDLVAMRRCARSIRGDMHHLSDLVDGFLRLARPFAQLDASHHVPVFVHDVVIEAVRRSQSLANDHGVAIVTTLVETDGCDDAPEVLGESVLLEAMIENLLRNAVRFSARGGKVDIEVRCVAASTLLCVRDRGAGIAPENLASVFDWFFDRPAHDRRSTGPGFGLAIVKRVAEHHGGTIVLRNRREGGCEFEITLPRWSGAARPPERLRGGDPGAVPA
jgi:signal transduction histidine kinase